MEEKTETIPETVEESIGTEVEDENPLKTKKPRKPFVMTEARKETLAKGRAKRQANIAKLQDEKAKKHAEQKAEKKKVTQEVKEEVAKKIQNKDKKKVKITMPDSDVSSDEDYEIEIKKAGRKKIQHEEEEEEEQYQPPLKIHHPPPRNNIILV